MVIVIGCFGGKVLDLSVSVRWDETGELSHQGTVGRRLYISARGAPKSLNLDWHLTAAGRPVTYRGIKSAVHGALASGY